MKCICGFEEKLSEEREKIIYYKSGKKKGLVREKRIEHIPSVNMDKINVIGMYEPATGYYGYSDSCNCKQKELTLKVCPDCKLVYFDYYF